jgi:23S rRNA pseudouridine1911/1915/1917 synthase
MKKDSLLEVKEKDQLLPFVLQQLKHKNRDNIKSLLRKKQVWVNGQAISQYNHDLQPGDQVVIRWELAEVGDLYRGIRIVFEDDHIIVIDKQAGLLSISAGSEHTTAYSILSQHVKLRHPSNKIFVVHRLDRDTSGLMLFAKSEAVQRVLQRSWQTNITERTYIALVEGLVQEQEGTIRSYLFESKAFVVYSSQDPSRGELAVTHFRTLKSSKDFSLLEVHLETGKKNQIRVHMQDIGHSIAGDKKYGATGNPIGRLGLHACVLAFSHPITSESLRFESKIPGMFLRLFK